MKRFPSSSVALIGLLLAAEALHANPYRLQYGGRITQSNGQPLQGNTSITVAFYHSASGGSSVALQAFNSIPLTDGIFNVTVELTPAEFHAVFSASEAWVEITDLTSGTTYPRQRFAAVPYAFKVPVDGTTIGYNTNGQLRVQGLAGHALPSSSPSDGQILKWRSATGWEWGSDDGNSAPGAVNSAAIQDGSIANADIAATAAIAGTKISPNFGSQNIVTTGTISGDGSGLTNLPAGPLGSSIDSSEVTDGSLVDADISGAAAIAQSKISGLSAALAAKEPAMTSGTSAQYLRGDKTWSTLDTSAIPENTNLYFTDTRARAAISASAPLSYNTATGVLSLPAATSVANGYLSSADWLSFNNKQAAITAASALNIGSLSTALQKGLEIKPFDTNAGQTGEIRFNELTGSNYVGFKAPDAITADKIWILPAADGTNGQYLSTNGSGVLSWVSAGGSGTVTSITAGTGLSGGTITGAGTIDLANTAVAAGSYTRANITVDAQGRLTAAANGSSVNLASEVTGTLPVANGGTGATTAADARTNLGLGSLATLSAVATGQITDGTIADDDISASAAIAQSKINGLTTSLSGKEPSITAGTTAQFFRGDKSWQTLDTSAVPENTNLYFTDARARAAISGSAPVAYNSTSGAISMAAATSVANGYLSSGDWLTFNNKQAAISASSTVNTGTLTSALQNGILVKPFGSSAGEAGELRFTEVTGSGSNHVGFKAPDAIAADKIWTLPAADGTNGQVLSTNGSGVLSWASGNAGTVTSITAGTGLSGGTITGSGTIDLANTAVTAGSYTRANVTVDAQGRLTAAANGSNVNLTSEVTGTLPVANGGTGAATLTSNGILFGNGTSAIAATAAGSQYNVLVAGSGGTPSFGQVALGQSAAVSGQLTVGNGGTGLSAGTSGGIPYFSAASTIASSAALTANGVVLGGGAGAAPSSTSAGSAYQTLRVPSGGGAPAFGALDLSQSAAVTNALGVANGGTGLTAGTSGGVPYYSAAGTMASSGALTARGIVLGGGAGAAPTSTAALTNGQLLIGSTSANPVAATLSQGSNAGVTISNGAGSITLDTAQDIRTSATPTFAGVSLGSGTLSATNLVAGSGDAGATPGGGTVRAASGAGANITGSNLTITPGNGTGTGGSGSLLFQTAPAAASSSTANTMATRMTIDKTGNVGIGTTSPAVALDVAGKISLYDGTKTLNGGLATEANATVINFGMNEDSFSRFGGTYSSASQGGLFRVDTRNIYPLFQFQGRQGGSTGAMSSLMSITAAGNVGIGTNSPGARLSIVNPTQGANHGAGQTNGGLSLLSSGAEDPIIGLTLSSGGRSNSSNMGWLQNLIGVNTYYDSTTDTLKRYSTAGGFLDAVAITMTSDGYYAGGNRIAFWMGSNGDPVEKVSITTAGNVGIGTTSPGLPLTVLGPSATPASSGSTQNGSARFASNTNNSNVLDVGTINAPPYGVWLQGTDKNNLATTYPLLLQPNGGNVGIGTSNPGNGMSVSSPGSVVSTSGWYSASRTGEVGYQLFNGGGVAEWSIRQPASGTSNDLRISTLASGNFYDKMTISTQGNVGIGTTVPAATLDVRTGGNAMTGAVIHSWNGNPGGNGLLIKALDAAWSAASDYSFRIMDNNATVTRLTVNRDGNVGIGTTSPSNTLHVVGSLCVKSAAGNCAGATAGRIYATTTTVQSADLAENMPIEDESLKSGDVVTLETSSTTFKGTFAKSKQKNQVNAVGVVSSAPGLVLGSEQAQSRPIALAGRVPVNVNLEGGKIVVGDYLVASSTPGQAMRAKSAADAGIIGIALSAYEGLPAPRQDYGDGIAHEEGHQVMLLVQNGAGSQSAVANLEKRVFQAEAESAQLKAESAQLKAESAQLKAESTQLKAESTQLKAESTQLKAESAQLKAESAQLKARVDKSEAESDELRTFLCAQFPSAPICK